MSILNRFLLFLYTLGVMIILFVIGFAAAGWTTPLGIFQGYLGNYNGRLIVGLIVVVLLILSIRFFLQSLTTTRGPAQAVVHETGLGQVRVTADAIESLVVRVSNQVRGVMEVHPKVVTTPEGIHIYVKVVLAPELNIPQTSDEIQNTISNYMSEVAGINVKAVKILVDSIASEPKTGAARRLM